MRRRKGSEGLTLIEMLVVLAIMGVMSSLVVVGLGAGAKEQNVQAEAQRLALSLQAASDEALTSDTPIVFRWDERGYELTSSLSEARATGEAKPSTGGRHQFAKAVTLSVAGRESPVLLGDPATPPLALVLAAEGVRWRVDYDGLNAVATTGA